MVTSDYDATAINQTIMRWNNNSFLLWINTAVQENK
jgi:hypothetical protein